MVKCGRDFFYRCKFASVARFMDTFNTALLLLSGILDPFLVIIEGVVLLLSKKKMRKNLLSRRAVSAMV